jgi:hypothetical protein
LSPDGKAGACLWWRGGGVGLRAHSAFRMNPSCRTSRTIQVIQSHFGAMLEYRVYTLDPAGHFTDVRELYCASDAAAVEREKELARDRAVEVWHRGCLIRKIEAHGR